MKKTLGEVQLLRRLSALPDNTFTTKLIDVILPENSVSDPIREVAIVMELMPTDLRKVLMTANNRNSDFEEANVVQILFNILRTVDFLHSLGVMHRDIKPANFLIDSEKQVKLCDLGAARPVIQKE